MKLSISEILEKTTELKSKNDKINFLRSNWSKPLQDVLVACFDPNIKFLLPEGPVPYTPSSHIESHGLLYGRTREFYLFVEGGKPELKQPKREMLFISLLESLDPKDAALVVAIKDKVMPYKSITKKLISEAFPEVPNFK